MEEFEYSVEICDRDWECFFAECEECNLLPPSLAGLEDSGMSDIDDTGSVLAMRAQRVDLTTGFSETDRPIDGPPLCEGSPVEHYLSKHGIGGMESVLSGSEEDIHLQSVNMFFERLKSLTEPEPRRVNFGKNSEAIQEKERCSDGQQASRGALPKNIQKLNFLPARGETAVGKETERPVDTIRKTNTLRKVHSEPSISLQHAASNSVFNTNKSTETELFIREEACKEPRVSEVQQWNRDSLGTAVCSVTTPNSYKVQTCALLHDFKQEELLKHLCKKCATDLASDLDMANIKWQEEQTPIVSQSDTGCSNKAVIQESPSASMKRKRRKKRRLSVEQGEGGHGYEKQVLVKPSDSEEEQCASKAETGLCFSEDIKSFYLNEPQKNLASLLTPYSMTSSSFPVIISSNPPCDSQHQYLSESVVRQRRSTDTSDNNLVNNSSATTLSQTDDSVTSAPISSATVPTNAEVCSKSQEEKSAGLKMYPKLPVLMTVGETGKQDMGMESQSRDIKAEGLHSVTSPENEQNLTSAVEVKAVTHSVLSSSESNATSVEVGQNDRRPAAKSVLAVEAGNSGGDEPTLCHSEAEPQQQLEMEFHNTDQYSATTANTDYSPPAASTLKGLLTKPLQLKASACKVISAQFTSDSFNPSPDESFLSKSSPCIGVNTVAQQTERLLEVHTSPELDISEKSTEALDASQITSKSRAETKSAVSEDVPTSLSDITNVSSCCTLNTESLSNGNITDMSLSFCSSVSEQESGGQGGKKGDEKCGLKSSPDSVCDLLGKAEDAILVPEAECKPERVLNPVFAMSSFWSEMEKLTINDILGLRMISKAAPPSSLPPLQENEEMADSGFFTQIDKSTPEQTAEDASGFPDAVESCFNPNSAANFSPSRSVLWESESAHVSQSADIYPENVMLTSVSDTSRPFLSEKAEKCLRKISKNISVHNLRALESESFSHTQKCKTLQTVDEGESQKADYVLPKQDKGTDPPPSSLTDSYSISLIDIFQYFLGGKQTAPSQPAADNLTTFYNDGNSVPETYDHFFSEFDTESFFYPLIATEDETKDKPVPIFSSSRSSNRNFQFPEAYDYFFASSSSSDESCAESDEEDNTGPVRVVTRFSRKASSSHISKDMYDDFFAEKDFRQNFFWKTTFSFRNINFLASTVQNQASNSLSLVPARQRGSSHARTVSSLNALGNEDVMFPDPLLYHFEDRVFSQLAQQPFRYKDLQTAVSNPRLDAPFLPLKQSDMCLVCIAFASWVLKTANPQVGDAWKAVLLANVSALSAIRYLRKYVKAEAAGSETKLHHRALPAPSTLSL
ncbi:uncharacterized protein perm1a [Oreochromis niloticus]|nr:PGC-1 and ERR-induced regulator in muscle protein 1 [Oreochromis niloticus]XP_019205806.1 PGC-1 and ERR-induced regulator in muscle protein 1 [Oreochromis niloticus]XP_025757723.1 PGC-1 and ERR-induced regulator in muscle protein 1 [Oreochromis niloticus]XP_025757724.1 PGC-1 and ERR-induced regulator in muscle protein 1 [Oreochromis niloticus]